MLQKVYALAGDAWARHTTAMTVPHLADILILALGAVYCTGALIARWNAHSASTRIGIFLALSIYLSAILCWTRFRRCYLQCRTSCITTARLLTFMRVDGSGLRVAHIATRLQFLPTGNLLVDLMTAVLGRLIKNRMEGLYRVPLLGRSFHQTPAGACKQQVSYKVVPTVMQA